MTNRAYLVICFCTVLSSITAEGLSCTEIVDSTTKQIKCTSDGLIWIQTAWWYNRQLLQHTCQRSNLNGQIDFKNQTAALCDNLSSCDVSNSASIHSKILVYYYCKENNCKAIPVHSTGSLKCASLTQTIVVEEAWADINKCIKSTAVTTVTDLTHSVSKFCDGRNSCYVPYTSQHFRYANIKYHCKDPGKVELITTTTTKHSGHNYVSSIDITTQYSPHLSTVESGIQSASSYDKTSYIQTSPTTEDTDSVSSTYFTSRYSTFPSTEDTSQGYILSTNSTLQYTPDVTSTETDIGHESTDTTTQYNLTSTAEVSTSNTYNISTKIDTTFGHMSTLEIETTQDIVSSTHNHLYTTKSMTKQDQMSRGTKTAFVPVSSTSNRSSSLSLNTKKLTLNAMAPLGLHVTNSYQQKTTHYGNRKRRTKTVKTSSQNELNTIAKPPVTVPYMNGHNGHILTTTSGGSIAKEIVKSPLSTMSLVAIVCSVSTMLVMVVLIVCYIKRRKNRASPRAGIEMHNPQYDIYTNPDNTQAIETEFQQKEKYSFRDNEYDHLNQKQNLYDSNTLFLGMHSGNTETSTDTYDHL